MQLSLPGIKKLLTKWGKKNLKAFLRLRKFTKEIMLKSDGVSMICCRLEKLVG